MVIWDQYLPKILNEVIHLKTILFSIKGTGPWKRYGQKLPRIIMLHFWTNNFSISLWEKPKTLHFYDFGISGWSTTPKTNIIYLWRHQDKNQETYFKNLNKIIQWILISNNSIISNENLFGWIFESPSTSVKSCGCQKLRVDTRGLTSAGVKSCGCQKLRVPSTCWHPRVVPWVSTSAWHPQLLTPVKPIKTT